MRPRFSTMAGPALGVLVLALTLPLSWGCEGYDFQWVAIEDTVTLYSLARPEYMTQPAAFDFYSRVPVVVEETYQGDPAIFDLAVSEQDGELVLLPAGVFGTLNISPGIVLDSSGTTFEELASAPREGYVTDRPVPVRAGAVYAVRTRNDAGGCSRYAKMEILEAEPEGIVTFRQIRNNLCNDRELIPPDQG